jgi:hypothetical protein
MGDIESSLWKRRTSALNAFHTRPTEPWTIEMLAREAGLSRGDGERTRVVCIYLHCDLLLFGPFLASLPTLLVVRREEGPSGQWFDANMRYLVAIHLHPAGSFRDDVEDDQPRRAGVQKACDRAEAVRGRPGASCLMARLTELLFIEILRRHMAQLRDEDVGWLAALNDRCICRAPCIRTGSSAQGVGGNREAMGTGSTAPLPMRCAWRCGKPTMSPSRSTQRSSPAAGFSVRKSDVSIIPVSPLGR